MIRPRVIIIAGPNGAGKTRQRAGQRAGRWQHQAHAGALRQTPGAVHRRTQPRPPCSAATSVQCRPNANSNLKPAKSLHVRAGAHTAHPQAHKRPLGPRRAIRAAGRSIQRPFALADPSCGPNSVAESALFVPPRDPAVSAAALNPMDLAAHRAVATSRNPVMR